MTRDMKFEALLVSQNTDVLSDMLQIMDEFSIDVDICMLPSRAADLLAKRHIDLLVLDCERDNGVSEVATASRASGTRRKMTVAALVDGSSATDELTEAGADVLIRKPLNRGSRSDFRNLVYSRMVKEWRREPRYAVRWLVAAQDEGDKAVPVTLMDISERGIGLSHTRNVRVADLLKFRLLLPGTNRIIQFDARVLWTVRNNMAGAEIVSISVANANILREWLEQKRQVRKLEIEDSLRVWEIQHRSDS